MSWMADVTVDSIVESIDNKIKEVESLKEMNPQQVKYILQGLKLAREVVVKHY